MKKVLIFYASYGGGQLSAANAINEYKAIIALSLNLYPKISITIKEDKIKRIPPIVGVPAFFKWLSGPSSLIFWPNFNFLNNGIAIGPDTNENIIDNIKPIPNLELTKFIKVSPI